ncbi:MAG: hypothetical protein ACRCYY_14455 [Trueperaceae bacterium]
MTQLSTQLLNVHFNRLMLLRLTAFLLSACVLLSASNVRAQSTEDILGTIGDLIGLIDDFSWEKVPDFACQTATGGDGEGGGDAGGALCGMAAVFDDVEELTQNYEDAIDTWSKDLFREFAGNNLGLGAYLTSGQLEDLGLRIDEVLAILEEEGTEDWNPTVIIEEFDKMGREITAMENANLENAKEGTLEHTYNEVLKGSPPLQMQHGLSQLERQEIIITQGQSKANFEQSSRISKTQNNSLLQEDHVEVVEEIAPQIQDEAQTAVSTRATIQEVVNAMTIYMQQDAQQFAFLSEQLAKQTEQEVYALQELQILTQNMMKDRLAELQGRQDAIKNAIYANVDSYEGAVDKVSTMGGSFAVLGKQPANLDMGLFNY